MANLTESATYDAGVYQLETTDPVIGGASGISNTPLKNLANRTAYLKAHMDALETASTGFAPLASPSFTGNPVAPTPALGDNDFSIPTTAWVQATLGARLAKSVAGAANVTLTAIEAGNGMLDLTGAITANIAVIVPAAPPRTWVVFNNTTGAFTLTVKTAAGTGIVVTQGKRTMLYCDGTNVVPVIQDTFADLLALDGAGSGLDADLLDGQHGAFYAPIASPTFTGVPAAPTAIAGTNTTQLATTAFVAAGLALKSNLASPVFTGTPTLPTGTIAVTQVAGNSTTAIATTAFVTTGLGLKADLASPVFTGTPSLPTGTTAITQLTGDNTTKLATTGFVFAGLALKANVDSPAFTGTPSMPTGTVGITQLAGNNSTKLATTAYADAAVASVAVIGGGQTWQSFAVGSERLNNTVYTNSTGKPIMVTIGGNFAASVGITLYVGGVAVGAEWGSSTGGYTQGCVSAIVPNGATYQSTGTGLISWAELR